MAFCRYVRFSAKAAIGCVYLIKAQHAGASNTSTTQATSLLNSKQTQLHFYQLYSLRVLTRNSATVKSTARPSCLVGVSGENLLTANQPLLRNWLQKLANSVK